MTIDGLKELTAPQLDELFSDSPCGTLPDGRMDGSVLICGTLRRHAVEAVANRIWQGKTFDAAAGIVFNRFPTVNAIGATLDIGPSWYDGADCVVLDYSHTPLARRIRDELRLVGPGLYLGKAYHGTRALVHFALTPTPATTTKHDDGHD